MRNDALAPVIAGLAVGIAFVVLLALSTASYQFQLYSGFAPFSKIKDADYRPPLQLQINALRESYVIGEPINFSVTQRAGGDCAYPELIAIRDFNSSTVREWNGTKQNMLSFGCGVYYENPATAGKTWSTTWDEANPVIINKTGNYEVAANHLFKSVHKAFRVVSAQQYGSDTSSEVVSSLISVSKNLKVVQTMLEKYPNASLTVTDNYYSMQFEQFRKYSPHGIVQYNSTIAAESEENVGQHDNHKLLVTIVFSKYYTQDPRNNPPLTIIQCTRDHYNALSVSTLPNADYPEIANC